MRRVWEWCSKTIQDGRGEDVVAEDGTPLADELTLALGAGERGEKRGGAGEED